MRQTTFTTIRTVAVPVEDQDRSLAFFTETLGFAPGFDAELQPGFRWIEVAPPGSPVSVAIVQSGPELPSGVDTGIRLVSTDARAEHAHLSDRSVDVGELLDWPGVPLMFSFTDPDGNRFYVSEPG